MERVECVETFMGTPFQVILIVESSQVESAHLVIKKAFDEVGRIQDAYSRFSTDNELAKLNAEVGEWTDVSEELIGLIQQGEKLKVVTQGAFDLSVKSVLEGWGYDADYSLQEKKRGSCGLVEMKDGRVRLECPIEIGGLGKGYAVDQMLKHLNDFKNICVNAGGDLWAKGVNEKDELWKVGFEHPTDPTQAIGTVEVDGLALACSSPSRRQWRDRHHLVNPKTGEPAKDMMAVYTQSSSVMEADAYATALFVMGYEQAKDSLEKFPVEAMLISPKGAIHRSSGFKGELFSAS